MPSKRTIGIFVAVLSIAVAAAADSLTDDVHALLRSRDFSSAQSLIERHLDANPKDAGAYRLLSLVHLHAGHWDDAVKQGKRAVELDPDNADSHLAMAAGYREKARRSGWIGAVRSAGKWKDALEKAIKLDPSNLEARKWLASYLANAPGVGGGDKDRAVRIARGTLEHDAFRGHMSLGYALRRRGDMEESIAEFEKAIAVAPDSADGHGGLGYTYLVAERFEECESAMRKYIEKAPKSSYTWEGLGDCFRNQDRTDEAITAYSQAVEVEPYAWSARWELARLLQKVGDDAAALTHFERLVELTPNAPKAGDAKKRLRKLRKRR